LFDTAASNKKDEEDRRRWRRRECREMEVEDGMQRQGSGGGTQGVQEG
jgi:hypothetical protein